MGLVAQPYQGIQPCRGGQSHVSVVRSLLERLGSAAY